MWPLKASLNQQRSLQFTSEKQLVEELKSGFIQNNKSPKFGDIGIIRNQEGSIIHAFVWINDNWVFTKNGHGSLQPYRFQKYNDMLSYYKTYDAEFYSPNN